MTHRFSGMAFLANAEQADMSGKAYLADMDQAEELRVGGRAGTSQMSIIKR